MTMDIPDFIVHMRKLTDEVKTYVQVGMLEPRDEVGPHSLIQLLEGMPITDGKYTYMEWKYHQFWVDKCPLEMQDKLIGCYIYEKLGKTKVVGIFDSVTPR